MQPADLFILFCVGLIAIVDVSLILSGDNTVSNRMRGYAKRLAATSWAWGVLGGHFFGPSLQPWLHNWWASIGLLVVVGGAVVVAGHYSRKYFKITWVLNFFWLACGVASGLALWPQ